MARRTRTSMATWTTSRWLPGLLLVASAAIVAEVFAEDEGAVRR
jgi:hypothetical protein